MNLGPLDPRPNVTVGALDPRPGIAGLPEKDGAPPAVSLVLADTVPDDFTLQNGIRLPPTHFRAFRTSLSAGFRNAFGGQAQAGGEPNARVILLDRADFGWAPAAVDGHGAVVALNAQVTYRARLMDASGKTLGSVASTAESKVAANWDTLERGATSAIESMYEEIAARLLERAGTLPRGASTVAAPRD